MDQSIRIGQIPPGTQEALLQQALEPLVTVLRVSIAEKFHEAVVELDSAEVSSAVLSCFSLRGIDGRRELTQHGMASLVICLILLFFAERGLLPGVSRSQAFYLSVKRASYHPCHQEVPPTCRRAGGSGRSRRGGGTGLECE